MRVLSLVFVLATSVAHASPDAPSPPVVTVDRVDEGQRGTSQSPPDVGGAATDHQKIDVVSGFVTIRDQASGDLISKTAEQFWTAAGVTGTPAAFSQHAVFSALNQRWYISAEEATTGAANRIYLAVSATGDARGPYKAITLPPQAQRITNTRLAVDACGAYLTGDMGGGGVVIAVPAVDLHWSGAAAPSAAHVNVMPAAAGVVPAIDASNEIAAKARMFIARRVADPSTIDLFRLHWALPHCSSTVTATLAAPTSVTLWTELVTPSRAAEQPSPAPWLSAGSGAITSAASVEGEIVGIATTESFGRLGAVWFQLSAELYNSTPPVIVQLGTIFDPVADLITPAIAISPYSGIGVVVVRTSGAEPPGIYVTAHGHGDVPDTMQPLVRAQAGSAAYSCAPTNGVSQFGRYSSISSTPSGFWAVAQYGASPTTCEFGTAWVSFGIRATPPDNGHGHDGGLVDPEEPNFEFGCGCATHGNATSGLACLGALALVLRRRRHASW